MLTGSTRARLALVDGSMKPSLRNTSARTRELTFAHPLDHTGRSVSGQRQDSETKLLISTSVHYGARPLTAQNAHFQAD